MISIIVSIAKNGCIGGNNTLLWKQSEDLKRFKMLTENHVIIMGENTYNSLPNRPLKNRMNIVITQDYHFKSEVPHLVPAFSIDDALAKANFFGKDESEFFIIGGGSIYKQFLPLSDKLYITRIDAEIEGDTYFPELGEEWKKTFEEYHDKDDKNQYNYIYEIYEKNL
jgi:dihydrofolate reductase